MAIRILDAATVGRIAAGEVVERPASVAKELIENALDAGSTSITVEIAGGGIDLLRVTDNGSGIAPEEVRMAFENHATSKLQSADGLDDIRTLGFRGEALPSIAAVSRIECQTRRRGAESGVKLIIEGGQYRALQDTGCPEGTTIILRDLFFNTPVRRTFLKKPNVEGGVVTDVVTSLMLGNPGVAIRLIANGRTTFHSFGDGNLRHAALAVYGKEIAAKLTAIDEAEGALRIYGLIGVGDCARPTRAQQSFFVNGRMVRCPLLTQALEAACRSRVTVGLHPMCILNLNLPPHAVDINVHPNKLEVRFRDEQGVRATLDALFARTFESERLLDLEKAVTPPPQVGVKPVLTVVEVEPQLEEQPEKAAEPNVEQTTIAAIRVPPPVSLSLNEGARVAVPRPEPEPIRREPVSPAPTQPEPPAPMESPAPKEVPTYRVIGVALNTYLLIESGGALLLIDQHAAHERILYERYAAQLNGPIASQQLLTPVILPVTAREMTQIEDNLDLLHEAGFDVEAFGERSLAVRAVPFILGKADLKPLFMDMLDALNSLKYAAADRRRGELIQLACKHAVKGGDALTDDEIGALIESMLNTASPATCPHGRPVVRTLSKNELERMFKRLQ